MNNETPTHQDHINVEGSLDLNPTQASVISPEGLPNLNINPTQASVDAWKPVIRSALIWALVTIAAVAVGDVIKTLLQVQGEVAKQAYVSRADLFRSLVEELGEIEVAATQLRWDVAGSERAYTEIEGGAHGLLESQASMHLKQAVNLQSRLGTLMLPPDWSDPEGEIGFRYYQSWFELEALQVCLERSVKSTSTSPSRKEQDLMSSFAWLQKEGGFSQKQSEEIRESAHIGGPCSERFDPGILQLLKVRAAEKAWEYLNGSAFGKILLPN
jgi:hypothetical protein